MNEDLAPGTSPLPSSPSGPDPRAESDDLDLLLEVMPPRVRSALEERADRGALVEVVLDLGRVPEARFAGGGADLADEPVEQRELDGVVERLGEFGDDNRAGIGGTLHRISAIRNRRGKVIGLTCRVGRAVYGTVDVLRDVIEEGRSALLLGRPGVGKTTLLREAARFLADEGGKRVVIVDTSNEIAGDGDVPHPGIGRARRMQVPSPRLQHGVMIEAVENHMPEVIVIDEIGTEAEALAARTIAERGVQLIATAHGNTLENLLRNPTLSDLVGGIQAVTLSDEEARRRSTQKTVLERKAPPTFDVVVEIQEKDRFAVHHRVGDVVDRFLRGVPPHPEIRVRTASGEVEIEEPPPDSPWGGKGRRGRDGGGDRGSGGGRRSRSGSPGAGSTPIGAASEAQAAGAPAFVSGDDVFRGPAPRPRPSRRRLRIYPYAVSQDKLERAIRRSGAPATVVEKVSGADVVLTIKAQARRMPQRLKGATSQGKRIAVVRSNTITQLENFLREELDLGVPGGDELYAPALREVEDAIDQVLGSGHPVELAPQERSARRLQHEAIVQAGLVSRSRGDEPFRRVVVFPG